MKRLVTLLALIVSAFAGVAMAQEHLFSIEDLVKVRRVGDGQISPRGDLVAYTITDVNLDANRGLTQIYLVPLSGGQPRQLTREAQSSSSPRWSPDGSKLAILRGDQIWI